METPVGAPLKEKFRIEIAKLREMTFREKLEYIWDYYKLHIIITCVLILIIGSLINTVLRNSPPQTVLFISWNAGFILDEYLIDLADVIKEQIIDEKPNEKVEVISLLTFEDDPAISMTNASRMVAMLTAGVIDVFILDSLQLQEYTHNEFIQPMEMMLAEIQRVNPTAYTHIEEKITYSRYETGDNNLEERIMGIDISDSPLLSKLVFSEQELYFSTSITSVNTENVVRALILFFQQPETVLKYELKPD